MAPPPASSSLPDPVPPPDKPLPPADEPIPSVSGLHRIGPLVFRTAKAYFDDNISRLGAALAFYTTVAVAPLLVLTIAIAGIVFEKNDARQRVIGEIEQLMGSEAGAAIRAVEHPAEEPANVTATVIGAVTLLFGGFGVFMHLQDALNAIWRVNPRDDEPWLAMLKRRAFSLATVVSTGFILLVSLVVSAAISWFSQNAAARYGLHPLWLQGTNFTLGFLVITYLFAMVFKFLPDVHIRWRDVWLGAIVTALFFSLGKTALAIYLAHAKVTSSYGVAGSLIALLLWSYYAGQIVFIGAEFTRVNTITKGGRNMAALDTPEQRGHAI